MAQQPIRSHGELPKFKAMEELQRLMYNSELLRRFIYVIMFSTSLLVITVGSAIIGKTDYGIYVVGILLSVVIGVFMVVRPDIGMFILVASVYTNSSDVIEVTFGIPDTNKLLVALTFVSVIGTRAIIQRRTLRFGSTELAIALYMVVAVVSLFSVGETEIALSEIVDFAKDFAIVLIIVQLCGDEITWKRMQWVLIVSAGILGTMTTYQGLTGNYNFEFWGWANAPRHQIIGDLDGARPTGPLDDPNYFSQLILMVMPMAFYRFIDEKNITLRLLGLFMWGMISAAAILTYSRAAFLVFVAIMGLIVLERKMNLMKVALGVVIAFVAVSPIIPHAYWDRIQTLVSVFSPDEDATQQDASFEGRTSEAVVALMMFLDHPLLGAGYGMYEVNYLRYSSKLGIDGRLEARSAHSLYLEVMAETGIIGILTFIGMIGTFYYVTQMAIPGLIAIGRADLIPWVRAVQLGFLSYLMTSVFLHDDWVRFFRLGLAIMASSAVVANSVIVEHQNRKQLEDMKY